MFLRDNAIAGTGRTSSNTVGTVVGTKRQLSTMLAIAEIITYMLHTVNVNTFTKDATAGHEAYNQGSLPTTLSKLQTYPVWSHNWIVLRKHLCSYRKPRWAVPKSEAARRWPAN